MIKSKHIKLKQSKGNNRKIRTQSIDCLQQQEEQVAAKAKNFLSDLTKEEGDYEHFLKRHRSKFDITLSQWSNTQKIDFKERKCISRLHSIYDSNKVDERSILNKDFSAFEMSLIDQYNQSQICERRKATFGRFKKVKEVTKSNDSQTIKTQKKITKIQTIHIQLPSKKKLVQNFVKPQLINCIDRASEIDISYFYNNKNNKTPKQRKKNRSRLPRLTHLQTQKNKYKSIFRINRHQNIMLLPFHSPISKEFSKIDDLIREESMNIMSST